MRKAMRRTSSRRLRRAAFTLLEVMLVLVILAAIAGIAIVNLSGIQDRPNIRLTKTTIAGLKTAMETYRMEVGSYPSQLNDLHEQPSDLSDPDKWLQLRKEPIEDDPWGNAFTYTNSGADFEIRSNGPDGQAGTDDDISSKKEA